MMGDADGDTAQIEEMIKDKIIYSHGKFTLYDSTDKDCIEFGKDNDDSGLRAGEVCVKTVMPKTKIGYFNGMTQQSVKIEVIEKVPQRDKNHFWDSSYIGT